MPAPRPPDSAAMVLSRHGITWYFDSEYENGTFANGDPWVVGPVCVIFIDPPSYSYYGWIQNGSMINPSPRDGQTQGYDSEAYAWGNTNNRIYPTDYDPGMNVAFGVCPESPLRIDPGNSLVSAVSRDRCGRPQLKGAAVLTVLGAVPPEGSFRPPCCGADKTPVYTTDDLHTELLAGLAPVEGTPDIAEVEACFERVWLDHVPNWQAGSLHPLDNMPDYGREIATNVSIGALMLHLDFTPEQKRTLLIRYVQLGIDLYGIVQDGGENNWPPNGGHASGRKWPILFAGLMLGDAGMMGIGFRPEVHFGEDGQTFYVSQAEVDITHSAAWDPDERATDFEPYETSDIGMPEWGIVHSEGPQHDNRGWRTPYRQCCTTFAWTGFVLAARIMGAVDLWNHDALFDYQDRYMDVTATDGEYPGWRCTSGFVERMWDTYRADYGEVWSE